MSIYGTAELVKVALSYPAIDNHAHPLLKAEHRDALDFEGLISEASGPALTEDAVYTVACYRATQQLTKLYRLTGEQSWEAIKNARKAADYEALCRACMSPTVIQCILIDDGLGGSAELAEDYKWHDRFTSSPTKRIVRVEVLAESVLKKVFDTQLVGNDMNPYYAHLGFRSAFTRALEESAADPEVVGFKSIACYRTGLDIAAFPDSGENEDHFQAVEQGLTKVYLIYEATRALRLAEKALNDYVVNETLRYAGKCGKPVQFHTGLGDNDITLSRSSPSYMQPIIKAYPSTKIVLLHSSYPFTREAGYLTAVYPNVFLDFGEIFPFLSPDGQLGVVRQVLELCPTNKIMWSTDGHWWPESYYLGAMQAREILWKVLAESVHRQEMTELHAIGVVKRALFDNANRIYSLNLEPRWLQE